MLWGSFPLFSKYALMSLNTGDFIVFPPGRTTFRRTVCLSETHPLCELLTHMNLQAVHNKLPHQQSHQLHDRSATTMGHPRAPFLRIHQYSQSLKLQTLNKPSTASFALPRMSTCLCFEVTLSSPTLRYGPWSAELFQ